MKICGDTQGSEWSGDKTIVFGLTHQSSTKLVTKISRNKDIHVYTAANLSRVTARMGKRNRWPFGIRAIQVPGINMREIPGLEA